MSNKSKLIQETPFTPPLPHHNRCLLIIPCYFRPHIRIRDFRITISYRLITHSFAYTSIFLIPCQKETTALCSAQHVGVRMQEQQISTTKSMYDVMCKEKDSLVRRPWCGRSALFVVCIGGMLTENYKFNSTRNATLSVIPHSLNTTYGRDKLD